MKERRKLHSICILNKANAVPIDQIDGLVSAFCAAL